MCKPTPPPTKAAPWWAAPAADAPVLPTPIRRPATREEWRAVQARRRARAAAERARRRRTVTRHVR